MKIDYNIHIVSIQLDKYNINMSNIKDIMIIYLLFLILEIELL